MIRIAVLTLVIVAVAFALTPEQGAAQLAPRDQESPDIDGSVMVWTEDRGAGSLIYAKRIFGNGLPIGGATGGEWLVSRPPSTNPGQPGKPPPALGDQRWPALYGDLLVYSSKMPGGADYDLYAQRLFSNGRAKSAAKMIAGGPGDQKHPDLAMLSRGDWLVVWSEDTKDAGDIMGLRLTRALTVRGAPFPIAQGPGTADEPTIEPDPRGSSYYIALWTDDRNGNKDIYGTRVAASGLPRSGPAVGHFAVIDTPEDDYGAALAVGKKGTSLSSSSILLWTHDHVTDGPDVMAQRLRSNGYAVGSSITVAGGPGVQAYPAATEQRGEWLNLWTDDGLGTLDIVGVEMGVNGLSRRKVRAFVSD